MVKIGGRGKGGGGGGGGEQIFQLRGDHLFQLEKGGPNVSKGD